MDWARFSGCKLYSHRMGVKIMSIWVAFIIAGVVITGVGIWAKFCLK